MQTNVRQMTTPNQTTISEYFSEAERIKNRLSFQKQYPKTHRQHMLKDQQIIWKTPGMSIPIYKTEG